MPKIKTPNGTFKYKTVPLYLGVKQIDKEISKRNLFRIKELFDQYGIEFMLSYGTLLGAVRDKDFITHDEDIDLVIKEQYRSSFLSHLDDLRREGFELVRFDRRSLYSIMKDGEYIDLYFFRPIDEKLWECSASVISAEFMQDSCEIDFLGGKFKTHSNYIGMLECEYGLTWNVPAVWNNYQMSTFKKIKFTIKEHFKDILPEFLFKILAKKQGNYNFNRTVANIERYKQRQKPNNK